MKDVAGQPLTEGARVIHFRTTSTVVEMGKVIKVHHESNQVQIEVEQSSYNWGDLVARPAAPPVMVSRRRVVVLL